MVRCGIQEQRPSCSQGRREHRFLGKQKAWERQKVLSKGDTQGALREVCFVLGLPYNRRAGLPNPQHREGLTELMDAIRALVLRPSPPL